MTGPGLTEEQALVAEAVAAGALAAFHALTATPMTPESTTAAEVRSSAAGQTATPIRKEQS